MKRATKDSIAYILLWKGFGLGIFFIAYGIGSYFFDIAGSLTPFMIWGWGIGLIIFSGVGYFMLKEKKKRRRK